ncbi:MAG: hypothetical protein COV07_02630 [Candidatus Vogelbacteria bacterium CG10_big_fil_rev_8_21_14_0_10_45_14]|uniref:Nudix hydrolase domain-containing protein n=1 Tax=Candidatus Vogelbacteria bacterium CG10_big_fil_rev_8_21_14_0_10_45_14 TaxID=1975042 RepID=A0A2H0RJU8_9BACT|nr:MAG: hypothetical protein COV07_02630 [Candidatus Vogelbacteria bacterium CG10_big_fil_rev_8_21_14_0_10_45_14]
MIADKDLYYVAVKVFLEKDGKLFIFKDGFGKWDLPGGRMKRDEFYTPLADMIERKTREELGDDVSYKLGSPILNMRHERVENIEGDPTIRIFAVGYDAKYFEGEVRLASHHTEYKWVDIKEIKPEEYFEGGWLSGVIEYQKMCWN